MKYLVEYKYQDDTGDDDGFTDIIPIILEAKTEEAARRKARARQGPVAKYWRVKPRDIEITVEPLDSFITAAELQWQHLKEGHI